MRKQTLGEYRVGVSFNPSNNPHVDHVKKLAAELIDYCHAEGPRQGHEEMELAMRDFENGAMWAVKAYTKPPMES